MSAAKWVPVSDVAGDRVRAWFLMREDRSGYHWMRSGGRLVRYATRGAASRAADRLNAAERAA